MPSELPAPAEMAHVVSGVTKPMLGLTFKPDEVDRPWEDLVWRAAVLSIEGKRPLTVGLSSDRAGCEALSAAMFQVSKDEVDDEMLSDALRELVNMTAGLLKNHMRLEQLLGLPRIVPSGQPPVPPPPPGMHHLVLKAERLGLVLWVFEGIV
jgi:hypothetical protein